MRRILLLMIAATLAGVPVRIHAEHGRDAGDPHGLNPKHNFLRRRLAPFVDRFIPVSEDLNRWLGEVVRTYTTVSRQGGRLKLLNLTKRIQDLLAITKLLTVFETYDTEKEALASFK